MAILSPIYNRTRWFYGELLPAGSQPSRWNYFRFSRSSSWTLREPIPVSKIRTSA